MPLVSGSTFNGGAIGGALQIYAASPTAFGNSDLSVQPQAALSAGQMIALFESFAGDDYVEVSRNGYLLIHTGSGLPADAELFAGELILWFDQTDGAAKLMLKGKTTNGTVRVGSVNLA